jgi:multidrug transporter EmrE-like cation transporter
MSPLCLLLLLTILTILYTLMCKKYITSCDKQHILYIVIIDLLTIYLYIKLLKTQEMSSCYSQLTCGSIIIMTILGIVLYEEELNRYIVLGIGCAIISILLLSK